MQTHKLRLYLIGIFSAFALTAIFAGSLSAAQLDPKEFMPVDEIKVGMKGIGKTVFSQTKIEEFQVEVLGIDRNILPRKDIIWVRMAGGPLEKTGIIAGMSGSPVYIDGRLIGAVAYGFTFSKEPLAGITPIADMIDVLERKDEERTGSTARDWDSSLFSSLISEAQSEVFPAYSNSPTRLFTNGIGTFTPLATPLMLSGFSRRVIDRMVPFMERLGFLPIQAGGGGTVKDVKSPPLEPGAGIAVQFVRGDLNMFGFGTLTYKKGDKVVAFGHSMNEMGKTDLPIATVNVDFLVPSIMWSTKFGTLIESVGSLTQDRVSAISGVIGKPSTMIPMTIKVGSPENMETFHFEVVRDRYFAPTFALLTVMSAIEGVGKTSGDYTITTKTEVNLKGYPTFSVENIYSYGSAPLEASYSVGQLVASLVENQFENTVIQGITSTISLVEKRKSAEIEGVRLDKQVVRPGDKVEATLFIKPYLGETLVKKILVSIPPQIPRGPVELRILDGRSATFADQMRVPTRTRPKNLADLIKTLTNNPKNNEIVVDLFLLKPGASIGGIELPSLPGSMLSVIGTTKQVGGGNITQGAVLSRQKVPLEYAVSGQKSLSVMIDWQAK